jgi:CheY-like chemotaxis protein
MDIAGTSLQSVTSASIKSVRSKMGKPKILLIDGNEHFRKQIIWALEGDFEFLEAKDRNTAIQYIGNKKRPDAILTELFLPPRSDYLDEGFSLLKEFKENAPDVKIIVVTTIDREDIIEKTRELGADDYIVKPFTVEHLKNSIQKLTAGSIAKGIERRRYWRGEDGHQTDIERRRYWRVPREVSISYRLVDGKFPVSWISRTTNMSSGGLSLSVGRFISEGKSIDLVLDLPISPSIKATGEVRWTRKAEDTGYHLGVQFSQIRDEDKKLITEYIYH